MDDFGFRVGDSQQPPRTGFWTELCNSDQTRLLEEPGVSSRTVLAPRGSKIRSQVVAAVVAPHTLVGELVFSCVLEPVCTIGVGFWVLTFMLLLLAIMPKTLVFTALLLLHASFAH